MAKYVPDVKTQRWVIISPGRTVRPASFRSDQGSSDSAKDTATSCPFCQGRENLTPPEVYRLGPGEKDKPGWKVRVVPNLYPITDTHEVIIHSPDHENDLEKLPLEQVKLVLISYRDRYRVHERNGQVMIFCNHGEHAGASLQHPHSQLVVVPKQINLDTLSREPINNIVSENGHFLTYCPDFSQWPLEVWIVPKEEGNRFGDTADSDLADLANIFQKVLKQIEAVSRDPSVSQIALGNMFIYNFYIYHGANWYIRIIPRFVHRAGFELGTGLNVNIIDPTQAAEKLKQAQVEPQ